MTLTDALSLAMSHRTHPTLIAREQGVVLPIALILLVIISFAGLLAARKSANFEQFSNNMRTNQVARVSAEDALRQCERIARISVDAASDSSLVVPEDAQKIDKTEIASDEDDVVKGGLWNTKASWVTKPTPHSNLIIITPTYGDQVQSESGKNPRLKNSPTCIIQAMANERFLVTARGLSNDADVGEDGALTAGSEVWLQSVLTPVIPVLDENGGRKQ